MRHPLIYIPTLGTEMEYHLPPVRMAGYVGWKLIRAGKVIRESPMQKNLLTNMGFDALGAGDSYASGMAAAVGTGSNAPAATDTTLQSEVVTGGRRAQGSTSSGYVPIGGAVTQDYHWRKILFTFLETQANGNLTEFGTFKNGGGTMYARQLFKDVGGTPTTIIKTNVDQLEVTYEYRCYPPIVDVVLAAFAISGDAITSNITIRPQMAGSSWFGPLADAPNSSGGSTVYEDSTIAARTSQSAASPSSGSSSSVFSSYVNGNFYQDETIKFEPGVANFTTGLGLFKLFSYSAGYLYQASLATKIPKTNVKRTTIVIRRSWARFP
jgi:hypothetical protein